jgi:hypothetical protein
MFFLSPHWPFIEIVEFFFIYTEHTYIWWSGNMSMRGIEINFAISLRCKQSLSLLSYWVRIEGKEKFYIRYAINIKDIWPIELVLGRVDSWKTYTQMIALCLLSFISSISNVNWLIFFYLPPCLLRKHFSYFFVLQKLSSCVMNTNLVNL